MLAAKSASAGKIFNPALPKPSSSVVVVGDTRGPRHFVPLKNAEGELIRLDKRELGIDPSYQRPINKRSVNRIANNWSWIACGALLISLRSDGKGYFVVDGQHRLAAAKMRDDIRDLPCLAFELDSVRDEAIGFLATNTDRKVPSLTDQFNALLLANDPVSKVVDELARESGRAVGKPADKTHISCVGEMMRGVREDELALRKTWPIIVDLARDQTLAGRLVRGIHALERRMPPGNSLSEPRWHDRLKRIGSDGVLQSIRVVSGLEGNSSERTCAQGVLRALNKGLKTPIHVNFDRRLK